MNNVTQFPTSMAYQPVDTAVLRQAERNTKRAMVEIVRLFGETQYLPALHNNIQRLNTALAKAQFQLGDITQRISQNLDLDIRGLQNLQQELVDADDYDREEIIEDLIKAVGEMSETPRSQNQRLIELAQSVDASIPRSETASYLVQLSTEQEQLPLDIQEIEQRKATFEERRKTLTEAIGLIESKGFSAIGQETILNVETLAKMGAAPPQMLIIEQALEQMKKTLAAAEASLNFFGLVKARDKVREQSEACSQRIAIKRNELRQVKQRMAFIHATDTFDDERQTYLGEYKKVSRSIQFFLEAHRNPVQDITADISRVIADARALSAYLKPIR